MQSSQQSMQAFLPHSLKEYQGLLLLRSVLCEIPYEGVLVDSEFDFTVNLDEDGSVLDLIDGSVDSAGVTTLSPLLRLLRNFSSSFCCLRCGRIINSHMITNMAMITIQNAPPPAP